MFKWVKWLLGCLVLYGIGAAQIASADTINGTLNLGATNWNAGGTLTTSGGINGTWSLAFNFANGTGKTVDVNSFAVQLFSAGASESFTVTNATLNGGSLGVWEYFADDKLNNGSTPDCSSTSVKGWLCADTGQPTLHPYSIGSGHSASFVFSGTYTNTRAANPLDLMASGCLVAGTCKLDGGGSSSSNGNKWAVSAPMMSPVPEPGALTLLAAGFLLVGALVKRR